MKIGLHISTQSGFSNSPVIAKELGCECMQIFTSNPKGWDFKVRTEEEILSFKRNVNKIGDFPVFGHMIYLCNLAAKNPYIYEKSLGALISGLALSERAGFSGIVTHIGSHGGDGLEVGTRRIVAALKVALETIPGQVPILLETDSGSGNYIGAKFIEIAEIIKNLNSERVGVCLDTCHSFAAGYDLKSKSGLERTLEEFNKTIGLDKLKLLHLNDSRGDMGSKIDRHADIGNGKIGIEGFSALVQDKRLKDIPAILETPDLKTLTKKPPISLIKIKSLR